MTGSKCRTLAAVVIVTMASCTGGGSGENECRTEHDVDRLTASIQCDHVILAGGQITDEAVELLAGFKNLRWVWIRGCSSITGATLTSLATCLGLADVTIWNSRLTSPEAFLFAERSGSLDELTLNGLELQNGHLASIANAKALKTLKLIGISGPTDEGWRAIGRLQSLRTLTLSGCQSLKDDTLNYLRQQLPQCNVKKVD